MCNMKQPNNMEYLQRGFVTSHSVAFLSCVDGMSSFSQGFSSLRERIFSLDIDISNSPSCCFLDLTFSVLEFPRSSSTTCFFGLLPVAGAFSLFATVSIKKYYTMVRKCLQYRTRSLYILVWFQSLAQFILSANQYFLNQLNQQHSGIEVHPFNIKYLVPRSLSCKYSVHYITQFNSIRT